MVSVLLQAGHENRTSGATGATGPNGWTERAWTPIVANSAANWLERNGVDTIREDASFNRTYSVDYAIFLHFDGSSNKSADNASVGYSTSGRGGTNDKAFASFWKDYYTEKGWEFGFHADNYTTNLSGYYGYSSAINTTAEILIEFGTMSNLRAAEWMYERLEDLGTWVAEAIYIDAFGALPGGGDPDLIASDLSVSDTVVQTGDSATVEYNISNIGTGNAADTTAGIYLSTNSWISTEDILLAAQESTDSGGAGDVDFERQTITLPDNLAPGTYYLGVIADHDDRLDESVESNNRTQGLAITVTDADPDLIASDLSVSDNILQAGDSTTVEYNISNIGEGDAPDTTAGIYLSTNSWISNQDILLATQESTDSGGAGDVDFERQSITLPDSLSPGTYYLGVIADYDDRVDESVEDYNRTQGLAITIAADAPDLMASNVRVSDTTLEAGGTAEVSYDISNMGKGPSANTNAGVYLSSNTWISTQDILLGTQVSTGNTSPGGVDSQTLSVALPADLAPGTYYAGVIADHDNTQAEVSEANNNSRGGVAVSVSSAPPAAVYSAADSSLNDNGGNTSGSFAFNSMLNGAWNVDTITDFFVM